MKHYLVRHGRYGRDGSLTDGGKRQMLEVTSTLKAELQGLDVIVYHSPVAYAAESAKSIAENLGTKPVKINDLSLNYEDETRRFAAELEHPAVLVTHAPNISRTCKTFPEYGEIVVYENKK